ncbi:MAG TPA: 5-carboxymethyl-2-hydroxymuconate isomerase [Ramlibacter sp.]|nr:5-carboxymethyl-2-hydroxymuconate isomerase [Ramlibacter sp.]
MPHLVLYYTPNLDPAADMPVLCRKLADAMLSVRDEGGKQVFPTGGTRVLAYPATHYAVADGKGDYAFLYINLRMGAGRTPAVQKLAGDTVLETARAHLAKLFDQRLMGLTVQVDDSPGQVYDGKHSTLHPHFNKA